MTRYAVQVLVVAALGILAAGCGSNAPRVALGPGETALPPSTSASMQSPTPTSTATSLAPCIPASTLSASVFTGIFRFHVDTMEIAADGKATATWEGPNGSGGSPQGQGTFHLTCVNGSHATGVVDSSNDATRWAPGQAFSLVLQPDDMMTVSPGGPFPTMCGEQAEQKSQSGTPPPEDCGA